jgi:hypothetical protein
MSSEANGERCCIRTSEAVTGSFRIDVASRSNSSQWLSIWATFDAVADQRLERRIAGRPLERAKAFVGELADEGCTLRPSNWQMPKIWSVNAPVSE